MVEIKLNNMIKKIVSFLFLGLAFLNLPAQNAKIDKIKDKALEDGKMLYQLEMASWFSTDFLLEENQSELRRISGYASYVDDKNTYTIFWDDNLKVFYTVSYDGFPDYANAIAENKDREPSNLEKELIDLREAAESAIINETDTFFRYYENTNYNLIPVIKSKKEKYVYILTASTSEDYFFLGNDYLLTFNKRNKLIEKKRFHNTLIAMEYPKENEEIDSSSTFSTVHSHVIEEFVTFTSTDICTLLLYKDYFSIPQHIVVTKDYFSIFNTDNMTLLVLPSDFFENMDSQE
jgi:hypothetical protein